MSGISIGVCGSTKSNDNGFRSVAARLYGKINHVEPRITRELVRKRPSRLEPVVRKLQKRLGRKPLLPGFRTRILDGNHLAATEHRIEELRKSRPDRCLGKPWWCSTLIVA